MKLHGTDRRATTLVTSTLRFRTALVIPLFLIPATMWRHASAQQTSAVPVANPAPLTAEQVAHDLAQMNLHRLEALHAYQGTRTYRVEYDGFPGCRSAEMVVNVKYLSSGKKEFVIRSATGSKLIQTDKRRELEIGRKVSCIWRVKTNGMEMRHA